MLFVTTCVEQGRRMGQFTDHKVFISFVLGGNSYLKAASSCTSVARSTSRFLKLLNLLWLTPGYLTTPGEAPLSRLDVKIKNSSICAFPHVHSPGKTMPFLETFISRALASNACQNARLCILPGTSFHCWGNSGSFQRILASVIFLRLTQNSRKVLKLWEIVSLFEFTA